ncbi:hypothetical protein FOA52_010395 [Chlamydomonas sp. UWO 241]|nr:hypothetical protein FOA52_010395 [Chlamydomonas sp. UWO 241]
MDAAATYAAQQAASGIVTMVGGRVVREKPTKDYRKPQWKTDDPGLTLERITAMREEFWFSQPHYGGSREIWDALKGALAVEDTETMRLIIESAGIVVASTDLTICYDERGAKYELPLYVVCNPVNLAPSPPPAPSPPLTPPAADTQA